MVEKNIVVIGVVYPNAFKYLEKYLDSLASQTYKDFTLYLFNDGVEVIELNVLTKRYEAIDKKIINIADGSMTPAQIREMAIKKVREKFDYLIFSDVDDYFSANRIEESIKHLKEYNFCYNNLILVGPNEEKLGNDKFFEGTNNPGILNDFAQLVKLNCCGLSNTAVNLKTTKIEINIPKELLVVDWWLFSILLVQGYKGCYIKETITYYRQHEKNLAGGKQKFTKQDIQHGIKIKLNQYKNLLESGYLSSKQKDIVEKEIRSVIKLEEDIKDENKIETYLSNINSGQKKYLWWEHINYERK